jgi:hypothetical protein
MHRHIVDIVAIYGDELARGKRKFTPGKQPLGGGLSNKLPVLLKTRNSNDLLEECFVISQAGYGVTSRRHSLCSCSLSAEDGSDERPRHLCAAGHEPIRRPPVVWLLAVCELHACLPALVVRILVWTLNTFENLKATFADPQSLFFRPDELSRLTR